MKVNPANLRFTQDTIAAHFKAPHEHFSVREALEQIQAGRISPDTFPKLNVYSYNGVLWSVDNRRLWVFRTAKCPLITVQMMNTMHPRLKSVINFPSRHRRLSKADFLPRVRGSQNVVVHQKLHPRVAEIMARDGFSGQVRGSENALPLAHTASKDLSTRVEGVNVRGFKRQPNQAFGALEANAVVVTTGGRGSVCAELRRKSSRLAAKVPKLSLQSFPEELGGRQLAVSSSVTANPGTKPPESSRLTAKVPKLSLPSFPEELGGRHLVVSSSVTANPGTKPPRKAIADIGCSSYGHEVGIQAEQRHPGENPCADSPLLVRASTVGWIWFRF